MTAKKTSGSAETAKTTAAQPADASTTTEGTTGAIAGDDLSPATEVPASGSLIEPDLAQGLDLSHPAVDSNPREGTSATSNQIDFNDPSLTTEEAVLHNLVGKDRREQIQEEAVERELRANEAAKKN